MRTAFAFLLVVGLCALAIADHKVDKYGKKYKIAGKDFLTKYKDLLRLLKGIFQDNYNKDQVNIAKHYHIEQHIKDYIQPKAIKEFLHLWKNGFLPKGEVFSIFHEHQREETIALFNVLFYAKDWKTFYNTACWAREYVNEGMFVYAMHVAVLHRNDTQGMVLPAIYEIIPHHFVNRQGIDKAYTYKIKSGCPLKTEKKSYYVNTNYSGSYIDNSPTMKGIAYFTEDVGLNSYYYNYNMEYPFWLGGGEYDLKKDRRGELFDFVYKQVLSRYYLETLTNEHRKIPVFDEEEPIKTGFIPTMRSSNGVNFPVRPVQAHRMYNPHKQPFIFTGDDNACEVQEFEDYERRIRDAVDYGFIFTENGTKIDIYKPEGFEYFGRLIEGSPDSPNRRFFGTTHQILGYFPHPTNEYKAVSSAMEHYETCLRDPIFFELYERINMKFLHYKSHLPHYSYSELNYPGVKINHVHVDKLVTYLEHFDWDMTNAVYLTEEEFTHDTFEIRARQWRLNHPPFTYNITAVSDKSNDVMVKVFLGPKYDEQGHMMHIKDNWMNFFQIDEFHYTMTVGKNVIKRNSSQADTARDHTTYRALYNHVMSALKGDEEFHVDMTKGHNKLPTRLMLPKGTTHGQEFQFFVFLYPLKPAKCTNDNVMSSGVGNGSCYTNNMPMGYPLDRPISDKQAFFVPNSHMKTVKIFHQTEKQIKTYH